MDRTLMAPAALLALLLVGAVNAAPADAPVGPGGAEWVELEYVLKTPAPEATLAKLRKVAEARGGYLVVMSSDAATVDLPVGSGLDWVQQQVEGLGLIVSRNVQRKSVSAEVRDLDARIRAREAHLSRLRKLFADVDFSQTLALEKEMHLALEALDRLKGRRAYLLDRASMLRLTMRLQAPQSKAGPDIVAPAPWIYDRNLETLLRGFEQ